MTGDVRKISSVAAVVALVAITIGIVLAQVNEITVIALLLAGLGIAVILRPR